MKCLLESKTNLRLGFPALTALFKTLIRDQNSIRIILKLNEREIFITINN